MPRLVRIHWRSLEKVLLKKGFQLARQKGSHRSYTKPGIRRPVVVPEYDELPEFVILNCLRSAGISREEFFAILDD